MLWCVQQAAQQCGSVRIGSAVYEIWEYQGTGKIVTLKTITFRGS